MAAILVAAISTSGCTLAFTYGGPRKRFVRHETRKQNVAIQAVPSDAVIVDGEGKPHPAPAEFEASYDVELVHYERTNTWAYVGLIGTAALVSTGFYLAFARDEGLIGYPLVGLGMLDGTVGLMSSLITGVMGGNDRARAHPREVVKPQPLNVQVKWANAAPQKATLAWPEQRSLTVVRASLGTFDEALINWAETGERTPSAEGLFNLGSAYAARAVASDNKDDAGKALAYFARYLETDGVSDARRARVEELSRPLRSKVPQ